GPGRGDDGRRAGGGPLRRLRLLVPALPPRRGRVLAHYRRQPTTSERSASCGCSCQSVTTLLYRRSTSGRPVRTFGKANRWYAATICAASPSVSPQTSVTLLCAI